MPENIPKKLLTLCIVHQHPNVLLGMKKRGFGAGRWNGFGGKVGKEETIEQAAYRELKEEAGIAAEALEKHGVIEFTFHDGEELLEVHIFKTGQFAGMPAESDEMRPRWFHVDEIPYTDMWPDDIHWVPLFLQGKKFTGRFHFGEGDSILKQELRLTDELP